MTEAADTFDTASPLSHRVVRVTWTGIVGVALASLSFFYSRSLSNLYGDGIAHVEGARPLNFA